jgi:hypothetical protein
MRKTLEGRSPLCIVGNKLCFATRSGNNICVHENSKASNFKVLGQIQVGLWITKLKKLISPIGISFQSDTVKQC